MQQPQHSPHRDGRQQAEPDIAGDRGDGGGREGAGQHLALQSDIDDPGALGEQPGEARQDQRHGHPDRGGQQRRDLVDLVHAHARPNSRVSPGRSIVASPPVNRITNPCKATIRYEETSGMSNDSSAPP